MSLHLQRDLEQLKKDILELGNMVETAIHHAIHALNERRPDLAEMVVDLEKLINEKEVSIEESCLKTLALNQPVAGDLRFIVVVLKVNNDLERMGDFAINVAERATYLSAEDPIPHPPAFTKSMCECIQTMVHSSLDALVRLDVDLARDVIAMDNLVDDVHRQMYKDVKNLIEKDITTINRAIGLLSSSRYLERIADMATNIAEEVIFMVEGRVIRHQLNQRS